MEENPTTPGPTPAALIGWGMAVLGAGAAALMATLLRHSAGEPTGPIVIASTVLVLGWLLLMMGATALAQRVQQLSQHSHVPAAPRHHDVG